MHDIRKGQYALSVNGWSQTHQREVEEVLTGGIIKLIFFQITLGAQCSRKRQSLLNPSSPSLTIRVSGKVVGTSGT